MRCATKTSAQRYLITATVAPGTVAAPDSYRLMIAATGAKIMLSRCRLTVTMLARKVPDQLTLKRVHRKMSFKAAPCSLRVNAPRRGVTLNRRRTRHGTAC